MRRLNYLLVSVILSLATMVAITSCGDDDDPVLTDNTKPTDSSEVVEPVTPTDPTADVSFAYGCDPSWLTEMESKSVKFYDADGNEQECLSLLKSIGFNAARFRVWVDPAKGYGPWCDTDDVVAKAKRAYNLGYKIMIDFHYSDNWADPGKQMKPAAWDAYATIDELAEAAADHTKEVLTAVKETGVDVVWVQIGNETTNGMMTTQSDNSETTLNCSFSTSAGTQNYIKVHNMAAQAAKSVFPNCKIVVHFDRGHNWDKFSWGLQKLIDGGAEFDIFGLSIYPVVTTKNWYSIYVDAVITNLQRVVDTYNKDVMICETGSQNIATYDAKRAINDIVVRAQGIERCKGVFYWEPECYANWNSYAMGGFLNSGKPSDALSVFDGKHTELLPETNPDAEELVAENLYLYDMSGEMICVCTPDDSGIWRGTITTTSEYLNFKAVDGKGNKFAVKDWDTWNSFVKATSTYDHFWFGGSIANAGTYDIWFDPNTSTWGGSAASK